MKVLQLIDSLEAGGAERMAVQIANELAVAGHNSYLCATRKEGLLKETINETVTYLFAQKNGKLGILATLKIRSFIKHHKIELIHAHGTSFFTAALVKMTMPRLKLVWHDHYGNAAHLHKRPVFILNITSCFFNGIISVNEDLRAWSVKNLSTQKVVYFRNFISKEDNRSVLPDFINLPGIYNRRIVQLANLRAQKDHLTLFMAFKKVLVLKPGWVLLLVGQDFNDSYAATLRKWVQTHSLENSIFFLGSRNDVTAILKESTIGVLSSKSEGLPVALLEYGMAGLPVVVTDVGACKEVVNDLGSVVPPKNVAQLATALLEVIEDPLKAKEQGIAFKKHVMTTFDATAYIEKLVRFYKTGS